MVRREVGSRNLLQHKEGLEVKKVAVGAKAEARD